MFPPHFFFQFIVLVIRITSIFVYQTAPCSIWCSFALYMQNRKIHAMSYAIWKIFLYYIFVCSSLSLSTPFTIVISFVWRINKINTLARALAPCRRSDKHVHFIFDWKYIIRHLNEWGAFCRQDHTVETSLLKFWKLFFHTHKMWENWINIQLDKLQPYG